MSFSAKVKEELEKHFGNMRHCMIAELSAIINMCGEIERKQDEFCIKIQTENVFVARKYFTLVKKTFNIDCRVSVRRNSQIKKNLTYVLYIDDAKQASDILLACGIAKRLPNGGRVAQNRIDSLVVKSVCCRRAYIRGAFLAAGSVTNPEKNYHMEFSTPNEASAQRLVEIINAFDAQSKTVKRKERFIVYVKDGEQIAELLKVMEAYVAVMEMENIRILKDMRNNVNRIVNCETANLSKTIEASVKQIEDIKYIERERGLSYLPETLCEIAELRLKYPDLSLKELGKLLTPPVGKSGVNHRLKKVSGIAQIIRENN